MDTAESRTPKHNQCRSKEEYIQQAEEDSRIEAKQFSEFDDTQSVFRAGYMRRAGECVLLPQMNLRNYIYEVRWNQAVDKRTTATGSETVFEERSTHVATVKLDIVEAMQTVTRIKGDHSFINRFEILGVKYVGQFSDETLPL